MSKEKSIKLSPKYGVNPTIPVCFWCGEEKNEIALLGHMKSKDNKDIEAPKNIVLDYEPCDKCKEAFKQGVQIIEAIPKDKWESSKYGKVDPKRPPISKDAIPTGCFVVVKEGVLNGDVKAGEARLMIQEEFQHLFSETFSEDT